MNRSIDTVVPSAFFFDLSQGVDYTMGTSAVPL